jgi:small subunit ribosomal protein S17
VASETEQATTATARPSAAPGTREKSRKRKLIGVVVSDKMNKTRVVLVERRYSHLKYGKFLTGRKKFKAHDENNQYKVGDRVVIVEHRPLSREKRWKVIKLLDRPQEA